MANILVIDDDKLMLETIKVIIGRTEHKCIILNDPEKVIDTIIDSNIDLLISDLLMPEITGFELVESIRKKDIDIKILVMSSGGETDSDSYLNLAKKLGADKTMRKPISAIKMLKCIEELT